MRGFHELFGCSVDTKTRNCSYLSKERMLRSTRYGTTPLLQRDLSAAKTEEVTFHAVAWQNKQIKNGKPETNDPAAVPDLVNTRTHRNTAATNEITNR